MRQPFRILRPKAPPQPSVEFVFAALPRRKIYGLVDSGSMGIRISDEWADLLGLDLQSGTHDSTVVAAGGFIGYKHDVTIRIDGYEWTAPVTFLSNWPYSHALFGLWGFFNTFVVRIHPDDAMTDLTPRRNPSGRRI